MTSMNKLFLSLLIIVNIFQSSYAMDRELIVREGMRAGLSIGGGALIALGLKILPDSGGELGELAKVVLGEVGIIGILPVCINVAMPIRSNSFWLSNLPIFYGVGGCFFALKKYQDYLDTKIPVNINDQDEAGETPLIDAVYRGSLARVTLLLEHGANPNTPGGWRKSTPLMYADDSIGLWRSQESIFEIIKKLLEHRADPNVSDKYNNTPLSLAIKQKSLNLEIVNLLLENKADPNMKGGYRKSTPLIVTVSRKNPDLDVINALLLHRADPNASGGDLKSTPLMYQVDAREPKEPNLKVINLLLENNADPNVRDKHGRTPLTVALSRKNPDLEVIQTLLENGADPNLRIGGRRNQTTPFIEAVRENGSHLALIKLLLENKADLCKSGPDPRPGGHLWPIFDLVLNDEESKLPLKKVFVEHVLKLARQNNFSIFDRQYRDLNNEVVFFRALDDRGKSVFDYAVEYKNLQAIKRLLELIDNQTFGAYSDEIETAFREEIPEPDFNNPEHVKKSAECKVKQKTYFGTLKHRCLEMVVKNIDTIDFENPKPSLKIPDPVRIKDVFHVLTTAPYRAENLGLEN